jgi:hypothetical protein
MVLGALVRVGNSFKDKRKLVEIGQCNRLRVRVSASDKCSLRLGLY